jgi:hypothetical protein
VPEAAVVSVSKELYYELQTTFAQHEAWIDELEIEDEDIRQQIKDSIKSLDIKLSDRIKE